MGHILISFHRQPSETGKRTYLRVVQFGLPNVVLLIHITFVNHVLDQLFLYLFKIPYHSTLTALLLLSR